MDHRTHKVNKEIVSIPGFAIMVAARYIWQTIIEVATLRFISIISGGMNIYIRRDFAARFIICLIKHLKALNVPYMSH